MLLAAAVTIGLLGQSNAGGAGTPIPGDLLTDLAPIVVVTPSAGIRDSQEPWAGTGVGAGRSLARRLVADGADQVWVVACAHGSTTSAQWLPNAADGYLRECVGLMQRAASFGAPLGGVVWMLGETDSANLQLAEMHEDRLRRIVAGVRALTGVGDLPFVTVEMPKLVPAGKMIHREVVDAAQRAVMAELPECGFVETGDLTQMKAGTVHWERGALRAIGVRAAAKLEELWQRSE